MATDLVVSVKEHRLIPASQIDWEILDGIRLGVDMACKLWMPRSLPHNRWYRALVSAVAEANGIPHQTLHETLKIKAGLFHMNISTDIPVTILHSTAFEAMDQTEFSRYTEFALMTILDEYVSGLTRSDLIRKIDGLCNLEYNVIKHIKYQPEKIIREAQGTYLN
jgi:hypothetical protein